ncbi:MAG: sugar ABC transporter substrate-binding protein [Armatimonadetes bacterium]|nr:sugar ABC transporter substrate-binding protein [Armatimonadota bacterium]
MMSRLNGVSKAWVGLAMALLLVVGAQSGPISAQEKKTVTIAVFMPNGGDPYYQNKSYGYILGKTLAEQKYSNTTVNVELFDSGGYEFSDKQISQVENAIQRKVSGIVLTAANGRALIPVSKKALAANIPVINDDVLIQSEDVTMKISENSQNVGRQLADFVVRRLGNRGGVVMLKGPAGGDLFIQRAKGGSDEFKRYPGIKVLAEQWHASNIVEATRVMENFLQAHGQKINGVWTGNTTQACAAGRVLKQAGWPTSRIVTVGADLHDEALRCMRDGLLTGVLPAQPVKLARLAVMYAVDAAMGNKVPKRVYTTDEMVFTTQSLATFDMSDASAPKGWKPPIK